MIIYLAAISSIDTEQYESAKLDGASRLQTMWYITLQLGIRSIVIDSQISQQLNASNVQAQQFTEGMKMASVIVSMLPIMCVFPLLQRHFVKGMFVGAIKA